MTPTNSELQAYADGLLPEHARAAVELHLADHPKDAESVRAWRELNLALRAAYNPVLEEAVPERLHLRPGFRMRRHALAAGLVALSLGMGGLSGWILRGSIQAQPAAVALPRQAAIAHAVYTPEVRHPVEVGAAEVDHLVRWLSKRLGTDLKSPKLSSLGYELVGGRLLSGPMGPVAHFMFQDARGARLTLYVSRQRGEQRQTAFHFSQEGKVAVFYWVDGNYGYALSGEMSRDALLRLANATYKQLNP